MKRHLCLWFPNLPDDLACTTAFQGRRAGLGRPACHVDPSANRNALQKLAWECERFSPLVGIEEEEPPSSLLLDISGCAACFGGESRFVRQLLQAMQPESRVEGRESRARRGSAFGSLALDPGPSTLDQPTTDHSPGGSRVRIGVADTIGAAWAVAHFAGVRGQESGVRSQGSGEDRGWRIEDRPWDHSPLATHHSPTCSCVVIVPAGCQEQALRSLPIEALRLPPPTVRKLHEVGLYRVWQLLSLPRKSLPSRFGRELLLRIDQALGRRGEWIVPQRRPAPVREVWESESPLRETEALEAIVARLVGRLTAQLSRRGEGVIGLEVEFQGSEPSTRGSGVFFRQHLATNRGGSRKKTPDPVRGTVGLSLTLLRPTTDCRHVMDLLRLRWERIALPADVTRIRIDVSESGALPTGQHRLWETGDGEVRGAGEALVEKLSSRLGHSAVLRPVIEAEQQPELACRFEAWVERKEGRGSKVRSQEGDTVNCQLSTDNCLSRPLWLNREPIPVEVLSAVPEGPPERLSWRGEEHSVARCWGPERITTGWWRGEHIRRDYYHVETADGYRLWLFRDWTRERWFLHAVFD